jgi:hypothetical protein
MIEAVDIGYCHAVGDQFIRLQRHYPSEQYWFSFVNAVYPKYPSRPEKEPIGQNHPNQKLLFREPEKDIPQYTLPFATSLKVTKGLRKRLRKAGFPTFDRDSNGNLLQLICPSQLGSLHSGRQKVIQWCDANLTGLYDLSASNHCTFEREGDYMLAVCSSLFTKVDR